MSAVFESAVRNTVVDNVVPLPRRKTFLVADLFCGAGGSSTGAQRAIEAAGHRMILTAVNHWPVAVATHQQMHPTARHYCQDIATLRPADAVPEGRLDLLMASPTCTHHSRARGGKPTSDQQRMDPWHVVTWLTELRVKVLLVENVSEFMEWGPVSAQTGRPVKSRKGQYFLSWVEAIKGLGFEVDYRVLNAADYGDATTRKRFFLIARSDGRPIRWPNPTHTKAGSQVRGLFEELKTWRSAREVIDWDHKGKSIFERERPLAEKTWRRILAGAEKFGWPEPFIAVLRRNSTAKSVDEPVSTITASGAHHALVTTEPVPFVVGQHFEVAPQSIDAPVPTITTIPRIRVAEPVLEPFVLSQGAGGAPREAGEPMPTIPTKGAHQLIDPVLVPITGGERPKAPRSVEDPLGTITTKNGVGVAEPFIAPYYGSGSGETGKSVDSPLDTVTVKPRFGLVEPEATPFVFPVNQGDGRYGGQRSVDDPIPTLVTRDTFGVVEPQAKPLVLSPHYGAEQTAPPARTVDKPLPDIPPSGAPIAVIEPIGEPFVLNRHGDNGSVRAHSIDEPTPTATCRGAGYVVEPIGEPFVISTRHSSETFGPRPRSVEEPLPTLTANGDRLHAVEPFMVPHFGERPGQAPRTHSVSEPVPTVTASRGAAELVQGVVHELTPDQYEAALRQGRVVLIDGVPHVLDVRFRMLEPKELARAMGFSDEETEYEFVGTKTEITKQIGNAVCVNLAKALVAAIVAD